MTPKIGDIIELTWLDAWSNSHGRWDPNHKYAPLVLTTMGYFVEQNDEGVLTATTEQRKGEAYTGETFTPWEMIVSMEVLV